MSSLIFEVAGDGDDPALRRLLRENPLPGSISLSFEREPNYFNASVVEGPFHQTLVARESAGGEIIGVADRSVRPRFVDGSVRDVGYMSQLRVHSRYGRGLYLGRGLGQGFKAYRELDADGRTPFYLMSIIEENLPARRLLTAGLPGYPRAREYGRMFTCVIYPVRKKRALSLPGSMRLGRGDDKFAAEIVDCLNRYNSRRQFAPFWTCDSLFTSNLTPSDFFLALDGTRLVGCLACWDQTAFKQTVVRGYSGAIARWRGLINMLSRLGGWPYLPEPNVQLCHSYASHLAIEGDDPAVFGALLRAVYNHNLERGYRYFMIGLAESNPLREMLKSYRPLTYISRLYLVAWDGKSSALRDPDARLIPSPEIALL
jgi:hypothetical protein